MRRFQATILLALLMTSVVPLVAAMYLVTELLDRGMVFALIPEVGGVLDDAETLYRGQLSGRQRLHAEALKAMAADDELRRRVYSEDPRSATPRMQALLDSREYLQRLAVSRWESEEATSLLAAVEREGTATERQVDLVAQSQPLELPDGYVPAQGRAPPSRALIATFAVPAGDASAFERLGGVQQFLRKLASEEESIRAGWYYAAAATLAMAVLAAVMLGLFISRQVTRRVGELARGIERVAAGDLDVSVKVAGRDELSELISEFNEMVQELKEGRERIGYLERISAWQEVARRLAHEIKNPLTPINLAVQELHRRYQGDDPRFKKVLDTSVNIVEEEVATLKRLVEAFSSFARLPELQAEEAELGSLVDDIMMANAHLSEEAEIAWTPPRESIPVHVDRLMIRQVLGNLLRNAIQAAQGAGTDPKLRVSLRVEQRRGRVHLMVEDNGPGVPPDQRRRIFDPYYTTKSDGTGLGLAIVRKIVLMHGGEVGASAAGPELGGAAFSLVLPLHGASALTSSSGAWRAPSSSDVFSRRELLEAIEAGRKTPRKDDKER